MEIFSVSNHYCSHTVKKEFSREFNESSFFLFCWALFKSQDKKMKVKNIYVRATSLSVMHREFHCKHCEA